MDTKKCTVCKKELSFAMFNKHAKKKHGLQPACKQCNSDRSKIYYRKNKEEHRKKVNQRTIKIRDRNRQFIIDYLKKNHCVDCNISDFRVLEFDHVRGNKTKAISEMVHELYSLEAIEKEILKCEVRCKNCHAIKTYERLGSTDYKSLAMRELNDSAVEIEKSI